MLYWLNVTKEYRGYILRLEIFEFKGPFKKAKSRSFGDRNNIFDRLAQCDKVKQKKISVFGGLKRTKGAQWANIHNVGYRNVIFVTKENGKKYNL